MQKLLIQNISQLVDALYSCSMGIFDYQEVMESAELTPSDIAYAASWSAEGYTRNVLERNEDFELILICWEPGQETPIHDHNHQRGWVRMIDGQLTEEVFDAPEADAKPTLKSQKTMEPPSFSYLSENVGIHRLKNTANTRSISVHLYVKPLEQATVYDERGNTSTIHYSK